MSTSNQLILKQGKPFAFTFSLTEADGETPINLPSNCGFRMWFKSAYTDEAPLLAISSEGANARASQSGETFQIAVPSSETASIAGPSEPATLLTDIEIFDLESGECVVDGGAYPVAWYPEVTK